MIISLNLACMPLVALSLFSQWFFFFPLVGILFKCFFFSWIMRKKVAVYKTFLAIFFANIITSVLAIFFFLAQDSSSLAFFLFIPFFYVLCLKPAKRLQQFKLKFPFSQYLIQLTMTILLIVYVVFWQNATYNVVTNSVNYWILKLTYIYSAVTIGFFLSAGWEEFLVARFLKMNNSFISEVYQSNLYTMLITFFFLAVYALPQRLNSPNFLIPYN